MTESIKTEIQTITSDSIKDCIYTIRGVQVMLDSDLAKIYGYTTKRFNEQIKNNIEKFPEDFMFLLTEKEVNNLRTKFSTSSWGGARYLPHAFTEQGIYMLMTVLKGELATKQSLALVRIFKQMKDYLADNAIVFQRMDKIELKQLEADEKFKEIFKQLEAPREKKACVFSAGQLWDAASCIEEIFKKAKKNITVIDKYVDNQTLDLLTKKNAGVSVTIVTDYKYCKLTAQEVALFCQQYGKLDIKEYTKCHDRYIILDSKTLYHCGASLKDAGKQLFSIDIIDEPNVLKLINTIVKNIE